MFKVDYIDFVISQYGYNAFMLKSKDERKFNNKIVYKVEYQNLSNEETIEFHTFDKNKIVTGGTIDTLNANYQ
jgi:hypothetical protein